MRFLVTINIKYAVYIWVTFFYDSLLASFNKIVKEIFLNFFQSNPANYYHCKYYKRVGNFKGKQRIFIINYFVFNYVTWKSKQSIKLFSLGAMKENKQEEFLYLYI